MRYIPAVIILALTCGIIAQFVWKMVYFPEPITPIVLEMASIIILAIIGIYLSLKR